MNKKALIILSTILILIILTTGLLFYFWKFTPSTSTTSTPTSTSTPQTQKPAPTQSNKPASNNTPKVLYSGQVISPIFFDDNVLYFLNQNAQYTSGLLTHDDNDVFSYDAKSAQIGLPIGLQKVLWGDTKDDFIVEYPQNDGAKYIYYNSTQGEVDFPSQVKQLAWLPKTGRVVYFWKGLDGKLAVYSAKPNNTDFRKISDIWDTDSAFSVAPNGGGILIWKKNLGTQESKITFMSIDGKQFKSITKDGVDQGAVWSPNSNDFVFSRLDPKTGKNQIWMSSLSNPEATKNLGFYGSLDSVIWSKTGKNLYIVGSVDADGLLKLYRILAATLDRTEISPVSQKPKFLAISPKEDILVLVNSTGRLSALPLQ